MAKGKVKGSKRRPQITCDHLWMDMMEHWMTELADSRLASQWIRKGSSFKGKCFCKNHDDSTASFVVTPDKGIAKCFGCSRTWMHPIHFVAALREISFENAAIHLRKTYGLKKSIPDTLFEKVKALEENRRRKNEIALYMCDLLARAFLLYPNLPQELLFLKGTIEWLMARKIGIKPDIEPRAQDEAAQNICIADPPGVWAHICSNLLVGVMPPLVLIENFYKGKEDGEAGYAFFRDYFSQFMDPKYVGSIVFMYHDEPNSVCRFKLRLPVEDKVMVWVGDKYEDDLGGFRGFFGFNYYRMFVGGKQELGATKPDFSIIAHIHEGEFDALAAIGRQILSGSEDYMALAVGGSSVQALDRLAAYGITQARIVPDSDKGGISFVRNCLERTDTERVGLGIFQWPDEYAAWRDPTNMDFRVKDPDEAIQALGYPRWSRYIRSTDCYKTVWEWVFDLASVDLATIPQDRVRERFRSALDTGHLVKHQAEGLQYCDIIEKTFGVDKELLFRDLYAKDEDEIDYVKRVETALLDHFVPVGTEKVGQKKIIHLWIKDKKITLTITHNDEASIESELSNHFGNLYNLFSRHIGDPAFLAPEGEDANRLSLKYRTMRYKEFVRYALNNMAENLPSIEHAPRKSQGLHYISTVNGEMQSYVINGKDVYKITHLDGEMKVVALDGPSDSGVLFQNKGETWLHSVKSPEDFKRDVPTVPLLFTLKDMLTDGWAWRYQQADPMMLALYAMCIPVMNIFSRQTAIMLNAEAQSGKSRFVSGFLGGTSFPRIHLVAAAKALNTYTAANIRSQWDNCSLMLCLEEFEDSGGMDKPSITTRNVLALFRDLIGESAVTANIGTASGGTKSFTLYFPVACCAIKPLRDAASLSRFMLFELIKDDTRKDPVIILEEKYGEEGIAKTREDLAVGMYPHMPRLRQLQKEIEKEFASGKQLPSFVPSRFRESLYPMLTMLKFLREQPGGEVLPEVNAFAWDFCATRRDSLARIKTTAENEQLFEAIMNSSFELADSATDNVAYVSSVRHMLSDQNGLNNINKVKKGVYYDAEHEWIVVDWVSATQGILAGTRFKHEPTTFLKQVSERSPHYISTDDAKAARVIERLADVMGYGHRYDMISIFSVKHILDCARRSRDAAMKGTPEKATPAEEQPLKEEADKAVQLDDDMVT